MIGGKFVRVYVDPLHCNSATETFFFLSRCLETGKKFTRWEFLEDTTYINFLLPGKTYLVSVASVNDQYAEDSDPQKIFIEPCKLYLRIDECIV